MGGGRGKDSAWEGIFGEDEDVGRAGGRGLGAKNGRGGRGGKAGGSGRTDWTKYVPPFMSGREADECRPPTFTKSAPQGEQEPSMEVDEEDGDEDEDEDEDSGDESKPPSPRVREDDYDQSSTSERKPREPEEISAKPKKGGRAGIGSAGRGGGGIGSSHAPRTGMPSFAAASAHPESGESTPSASSPHPGLGSHDAPSAPMEETTPAQSAPKTSFGRPPVSLTESSTASTRPRQSFLTPAAPPKAAPTVPLTAHEKAHFSSISNSFGARLLAKQGWQAGKGLGIAEDGRAVPIAAGVHLRGAGIGKGVRTEDSKREARRNGEKFSDDEEEEERARRRGKGKKGGPSGSGSGQARQEPKEDSWKKQKKVKVRVEHKTYEQLVAEAADGAPGVGLVLDARGGDLKEVHSMSNLSLSSWTPTSDATQLPELRHNLRLIVDIAKGDVEALAREGKSVNERRKWAVREEQLARQKIDETEKRINRLTKVQELVKTISTLAVEQSAQEHPSLLPLANSFNDLLDNYSAEYASEQLDEVIVGAIAQVMRRPFSDWEPFDPSSDILLSSLKTWKRVYNLSTPEVDHNSAANRPMTAWESVIWNLWLPKVRSTINNDWDAHHPRAAIHLIESWEPILPAFIRDNILDQLILPKVRKAVDEWDTKRQTVSLYKIVWPWFSVLGERMDEILEASKRRIRSILRHWVVKDGVPKELGRWKKDIYSSSEWDKLVIQYIIPKLGVCLREDFKINPANQDMTPFEWVMPWSELIRGSMMTHLLDVEFFPKWLDTLYLWLVHPGYKPDEVANWFLWWKSQFPEQVRDHDSTQHAFKQALDLMNQAVELGSEAPQRLRKPVFQPLPPRKSSSTSKSKTKSKASTPVPRQQPEQADITFRSLAEEFAAQNDLIFLPLGKSDSKTGKPLFKVSKGVDGRRGVTVYVGESAVFAQAEDGEFRAISLDSMVKRAL
jgi:tuftelin-interacting protein 11